MPRVKRGVMHLKKRRKVMKMAKGNRGARSRRFTAAREAVMHSLSYAYRDRRNRKRDFRKVWIQRINAAARLNGLSYNNLINGLKKAGVDINRKMLAEIAVSDAASFRKISEIAKSQLEHLAVESN